MQRVEDIYINTLTATGTGCVDSSVQLHRNRAIPDYLESPSTLARDEQSFSQKKKKHNVFTLLYHGVVIAYGAWELFRYSTSTDLPSVTFVLKMMFLFLAPSLLSRARSAMKHTPDDPRRLIPNCRYPPILLLRPFSLDSAVPGERSDPEPVTTENMLAKYSARIGSCLIGLGLRSQQISGTGAARFYVSDNMWQYGILELASRCMSVFVLVGDSPNLQWELDQLYEVKYAPEEFVFIFLETYLRSPKLMNHIDTLGPWRQHMPSINTSRTRMTVVVICKKKCLGVRRVFFRDVDSFANALKAFSTESKSRKGIRGHHLADPDQ